VFQNQLITRAIVENPTIKDYSILTATKPTTSSSEIPSGSGSQINASPSSSKPTAAP
jgi:hypothetical protein